MRKAIAPAFIEQPPVSRVSSACWITGKPARAAAMSASCMIASPRIGLPSSVTATAPAALSEPYSVSFSPMLPRVAAAIGKTRIAAPRSGLSIQRVVSGESLTGTVLGIAQTLVNPPAAAAAVPVAMVSLYPWPGSRRWTWISTSPGATINPVASIVSAFSCLARDFSLPGESTAATRPSRSSRSRSASMPEAGSTSRPPRIRIVFGVAFMRASLSSRL